VRFLLDESVDARLAAFLTDRGHDVKAVAREYPSALKDREVLGLALGERRVLITNELDFGELIVREGLAHSGVILFRLHSTSLALKQARLESLLKRHEDQLGGFLVVTEGRVRRRTPG
jgi:predicted nuclease of predicted toxin-antitoxin system